MHAAGQKPITYYRQVLALCDLPAECGIANPQVSSAFPTDVVERAIEMRHAVGSQGTGAYTNSQGIGKFRDDVAHFLTERDGHVAFPSNIFLTNGICVRVKENKILWCLHSQNLMIRQKHGKSLIRYHSEICVSSSVYQNVCTKKLLNP